MMRERRKLVELWKRGDAVALATLVRVEGSSYRKVGARLMVAANGDYVGSISGGCLEAEIVRRIKWLVQDGACVHRYSTLFDDTAEIPYGLGCGGTVDVLLERNDTPEFDLLMRALQSSLQNEPSDVTTWLPQNGQPFSRALGMHSALDAAGTYRERLEPPQRLFVFGAGDDAQPLVNLASLLGWHVTVVDSRSQWARPARFKEADHVQSLSADSFQELGIARNDIAVVMTHSYEQDRVWLRALLPAGPRYLGLLGARHRSALLASEVATMLDWPLEQVCSGLFAPVGLDLGGDGAEAISLAIIAEMQAFIEGRLVQSQRMTASVIEEQIALGGASRYLQTQCAL